MQIFLEMTFVGQIYFSQIIINHNSLTSRITGEQKNWQKGSQVEGLAGIVAEGSEVGRYIASEVNRQKNTKTDIQINWQNDIQVGRSTCRLIYRQAAS